MSKLDLILKKTEAWVWARANWSSLWTEKNSAVVEEVRSETLLDFKIFKSDYILEKGHNSISRRKDCKVILIDAIWAHCNYFLGIKKLPIHILLC